MLTNWEMMCTAQKQQPLLIKTPSPSVNNQNKNKEWQSTIGHYEVCFVITKASLQLDRYIIFLILFVWEEDLFH